MNANNIPAGFVLVPRDPTEAMIEAAKDERMECFKDTALSVGTALTRIYSAMIAAAPSTADLVPNASDNGACVQPASGEVAEAGLLTNVGTDKPLNTSSTFASPEVMRDALATPPAAPVVAEPAAGQVEALRHSTNEVGDCPHWCKACKAEAAERAATPTSPQAPAPQAVVGDASERVAFEVYITKDCGDLSTFGSGRNRHYLNSAVNNAWEGWKARAALTPSPAPSGAPHQGADALREADTPWQLLEMARRVSAAYRDGTLTIHEIHYLETMIERAEKMPTAARDVMAERRRQVSAKGWTPKHDDEHADGSLAAAAGCYARLAAEAVKFGFPTAWVENIGWLETQPDWPWEGGPKPAPLRRMLVKAGALILAEIERLDRAALAHHQAPRQGEQHE